MPRSAFSHVRNWVFDLDNTLYPPAMRLFDQIEVKMTDFVMRRLGVGRARLARGGRLLRRAGQRRFQVGDARAERVALLRRAGLGLDARALGRVAPGDSLGSRPGLCLGSGLGRRLLERREELARAGAGAEGLLRGTEGCGRVRLSIIIRPIPTKQHPELIGGFVVTYQLV